MLKLLVHKVSLGFKRLKERGGGDSFIYRNTGVPVRWGFVGAASGTVENKCLE